jgi:hypothetical protein
MRQATGHQLEVGCVYVHKGYTPERPFRIIAERFKDGRREFQLEMVNAEDVDVMKGYWYSNDSGKPENYWLLSESPKDPHMETDF